MLRLGKLGDRSWGISSRRFVGAFFPAKASRLYKQEVREVLVQPEYDTDRIFWAPVFGLTGKSKRNLINALK
jgi:hypothetical protein